MTLQLRPPQAADIPALAALCAALGYQVEASDLARRLTRLQADAANHYLCVAEHEGRVCGWIHGYVLTLLESEPRVEIGGLVVDSQLRGIGIGRALLEACEHWTQQQGIAAVGLRSNILREDAHRFYRHLGYQQTKSQHAFRKPIPLSGKG